MSRFANSQSDVSKSESVQGLVSYLEERWLERYVPAAEAWCSEMGAMHIDEVLDEVDAFAEALKLKPLEVKRFLGKPRSPRAAPAAPVKKSWADVESDDESPLALATPQSSLEIESDDAASTTAPSTCMTPEPTFDGFRPVAGKKARRTPSDTASTCVSEVSTVRTTKVSIMKPILDAETTFTIKARQVGALLGPNGVTLSKIERETGAKVSVPKVSVPKSVEKTGAKPVPEDRTIVVRGPSKKCVDRVVQICKARIAEAELDGNMARLNAGETAENVAVDSCDVGALLGKGGAALRKIEEATKARISVSKDGAVRTVVVRGSAASVSAAKKAIADALRCAEREVAVPDWSIGELLGKGGAVLRKIEETTKARISVSKETDGKGNRLVRIRAQTEDAAAAAEEAVLQIAHPEEHSIEVTSAEASVLIGSKGETVKRIQKFSGARVTIGATGRNRTVWISGPTVDNINDALNAMKEVLRDELQPARKNRTESPPRSAQGTGAPPNMNREDFPALR
jgi:polyribonucleotide nucleotidyltransferase